MPHTERLVGLAVHAGEVERFFLDLRRMLRELVTVKADMHAVGVELENLEY